MKVFVTGISGGLGREFLPLGVEGCWGTHAVPGYPQVDLTDPVQVEEAIARARPDVVIHTVGMVDVDACERDPARAMAVNAISLLHLRRLAGSYGFRIIYISTNDVFSGEEGRYREENRLGPINVYSMTKAAAETFLRTSDLIVRAPLLSWHCNGKEPFVRWLVSSLEGGGSPVLFSDQYTSPVTARTLARLLIDRLLEERGILHIGTERRSRWEVGCAIARSLDLPLEMIREGSLSAHRFTAPRPRDVSLDSGRLARILGGPLSWEREMAQLREARPGVDPRASIPLIRRVHL